MQERVAEDEISGECDEEQTLLFLDSLDGYLTLLDSLSSALRQGWLELASARLSIGSSRVSSTLLDLKAQAAATTVLLSERVKGSSAGTPHFTLSKWACLEERKSSPDEISDGKLLENRNSPQLRYRGSKHMLEGAGENSSSGSESMAADMNVRVLSPTENSSATSESTAAAENKRRYKTLSVFGAFVSPKLWAAQFSFETALETIVEIANMRSSLLSSFSQLQKNSKPSD